MFAFELSEKNAMDFLATLIGKDKIVDTAILAVVEDIMELSRMSISAAWLAAREGMTVIDLDRLERANINLVSAATNLFFANSAVSEDVAKKAMEALTEVRKQVGDKFAEMRETRAAAIAARETESYADGTPVPDEPEDTSDVPLG
jgi:hypothetical protein